MTKYPALIFIFFLGLIPACTTITALKIQEGETVVFEELHICLLSMQEAALKLAVENRAGLEKTIHLSPLPVVIGTRQVIGKQQTGTRQVVVCTGGLCWLETVPVYREVSVTGELPGKVIVSPAQKQLTPGETVIITVELTNQSEATAAYRLSCYIVITTRGASQWIRLFFPPAGGKSLQLLQ